MNEKQRELIKKIQALSERGIDGEQVNAAKLLKSFMLKFCITEDDLINEKRYSKEFKIESKYAQIFYQTVFSVIGGNRDVMSSRKKSTIIYIDLTEAEYIEIETKFDFIQKVYAKRLKTFELAFIIAFDLFSKDIDLENENTKKLSDEYIKEFKEAQRMSYSIKTEPYNKQLTA